MADVPAPDEAEVFKVPALLAPRPEGALPTDIEQIFASGAHIDEFPPLDSNKEKSNYEQVVRDLKAKAGFGAATGAGEGEGEGATAVKVEGEDGLDGIEKEMAEGGVVREVQAQEGEMEGVEGEGVDE